MNTLLAILYFMLQWGSWKKTTSTGTILFLFFFALQHENSTRDKPLSGQLTLPLFLVPGISSPRESTHQQLSVTE